MEINELPKMIMDTAETGCCPRFEPAGWDGAEIVFENKLFVRAKTKSLFHIPVNMDSVFTRVMANIKATGAETADGCLILSHDPSPWASEHLFAVSKEVAGEELVRLSGRFIAKVFEGPYRNAPQWMKETEEYLSAQGKKMKKLYMFYTACPKCAKTFGQNYVVVLAEI